MSSHSHQDSPDFEPSTERRNINSIWQCATVCGWISLSSNLILSVIILANLILSHLIWSYVLWSNLILSYLFLSNPSIPFWSVLFYSISSVVYLANRQYESQMRKADTFFLSCLLHMHVFMNVNAYLSNSKMQYIENGYLSFLERCVLGLAENVSCALTGTVRISSGNRRESKSCLTRSTYAWNEEFHLCCRRHRSSIMRTGNWKKEHP